MEYLDNASSSDASAADSTSRKTSDDWLNAAIDALVQDGIDRVKVQILAKKLGVSRSSFYWHFKNAGELHQQMLEHWLRKNTGPIIERAMRPSSSVVGGILTVFECWLDDKLFDPQLDIAVRLWARRSKTVKPVVEQADEQRIDAIAKMFMRHGYAEEESLVRARVLYFTQIGHFTLDYPEDVKARISHVASYIKTFAGVEASKKELDGFHAFVRKLYPSVF